MIANKIVIVMRSGREYEQQLDEPTDAIEAAEHFSDNVRLSALFSLQVGHRILMLSEIEAIEFRE